MNKKLFLASALTGAALFGACASPAETVSFRLAASPDEATVTMDDQVLGSVEFVEKRGVAMPPGRHRLTIEHQGYFPHDQWVEAPPSASVVRVEAALKKIPR